MIVDLAVFRLFLPMLKALFQRVLWAFLILGLLLSVDTSRQAQSCPSIDDGQRPLATSQEEQLFPIQQSNKWGFINSSGDMVIEPQFDIVDRFSKNRAPFGSRVNGKWGFIDAAGQVVVEPRFDNAYPFFGGRAKIKQGRRSGFVDHNGRDVGRRFIQVSSFYEERAFGKGGDHQWRMIDFDGNVMTNDSFRNVGSFSEGLAAFSGRNYTEQAGFIDREGKVVLELARIQPGTEGRGFRGGLAAVYARRPFHWYQFLDVEHWGDKVWGFVDRNGRYVIPPKYDGVSDFSECLATVWTSGKAGVINTRGWTIVEPKFNAIQSFSEGLAVIQVGDFRSPSTRYGYIKKTGNVVVEPQFSSANSFHEGLAVVQDQASGKKGYLDKTGQFAIAPQFDEAARFRGGLARVEIGAQLGYINHSGAFVWRN